MILQPSSYCKTYVLLIFTTPGDKPKPLNLPTKQTAQIKSVESILLRYKADGFIHMWFYHNDTNDTSGLLQTYFTLLSLKGKDSYDVFKYDRATTFLILQN